MQVIHCPPNEMPPDYARKHGKRQHGLKRLLGGNAWLFVLVALFIVWTVARGNLLAGKKGSGTPDPQPTAAVVNAALALADEAQAIMCKLPGGGLIEAGWTSWVLDGENPVEMRCDTDGTLKEKTP